MMDPRQRKILEAIVEAFIQTAQPVGSKYLSEAYDLDVSPATVRNEMAILEEKGYVVQPHTSAGRVPTTSAYRLFVNDLRTDTSLTARAHSDLIKGHKNFYLEKAKEKLYAMISVLASATNNISFATLPDQNHVFYIGVSNILKKPEFAFDPQKTTRVLEVVEHQLYDLLKELNIQEEGSIYIGEENVLPEFQSCSLMARPYHYKGFSGVMGILGPTRMDYAYNMAALRSATEMLND